MSKPFCIGVFVDFLNHPDQCFSAPLSCAIDAGLCSPLNPKRALLGEGVKNQSVKGGGYSKEKTLLTDLRDKRAGGKRWMLAGPRRNSERGREQRGKGQEICCTKE